jgi:hypothetical protein
MVSNINAAVRYFKVYNTSSAPTVGTTVPVLVLPIPGATTGGVVNIVFPMPISFATGISVALTTGITDADTGAVALNEHAVNVVYA